MELAHQSAKSGEGNDIEHQKFYLPAMPPKRVVAFLQRIYAGINRL